MLISQEVELFFAPTTAGNHSKFNFKNKAFAFDQVIYSMGVDVSCTKYWNVIYGSELKNGGVCYLNECVC